MIVVTLEYDGGKLSEWMSDMVDVAEAMVGRIFEIELDHVDVRCHQFGELDEYSAPLFVTIDVEDADLHHTLDWLGTEFAIEFGDYLNGFLPRRTQFRVWVRREIGIFKDVPSSNSTGRTQ